MTNFGLFQKYGKIYQTETSEFMKSVLAQFPQIIHK